MIKYLRFILTLVLLYGVYTETGIWTATALFLIFIMLEIYLSILVALAKRK